jgi:ABC-type bacteriocin/lantibiotic exporter with double-glycine peptidase domain
MDVLARSVLLVSLMTQASASQLDDRKDPVPEVKSSIESTDTDGLFPQLRDAINAEDPQANVWRGSVQCGPNTLYAYLRLQGKNVSRQDIGRLIKLEKRGSSLQQLAQIANQFGVPSEVIKCRPIDFLDIAKPCIIHLADDLDVGHYELLLGHDPNDTSSLIIADFIECQMKRVSYAQFLRSISGYALVPASNNSHVTKILVSVTLVALIGLFLSRKYRLAA